ncbi:MAG: type II secretion system protein [Chitinivibrionales bacterium]|nr:type II secretion system protein [Chitinivibrionales bacterium]
MSIDTQHTDRAACIQKHSGFTLVESLVTVTIVIILGVIIFTMFQTHNRLLSQSTSMAALQRQYDNVMGQVGQLVRQGSCILQPGEAMLGSGVLYPTAANANAITICDRNGTVQGGFRFRNGFLEEFVPATNTWIVFNAGGNTVRTAVAASSFSLDRIRDRVEIMTQLQTADAALSLPQRRNVYVCRN